MKYRKLLVTPKEEIFPLSNADFQQLPIVELPDLHYNRREMVLTNEAEENNFPVLSLSFGLGDSKALSEIKMELVRI